MQSIEFTLCHTLRKIGFKFYVIRLFHATFNSSAHRILHITRRQVTYSFFFCSYNKHNDRTKFTKKMRDAI